MQISGKKIRGDSDMKLNQIREQIADEIGDCFWFIALQCELLKFDFAKVYKMKIESIYDNRILQIARRLSFVKSQCAEHMLKPLDCMKRNIAKLSSRKARGVIKGNGDKR